MERNALAVFLLIVGVADCDFQQNDCDLIAQSSICLDGGKNVLVGDAHPPQLSAKYSFDDKFNIDSSGNGNHGYGKVSVGPGVGFSGASAHFQGNDHIVVPHSTSFASNIFSVTFWLHVERLPETASCALVVKGDEGTKDPAPGIFLTRTDNQIAVRACNGTLTSRARVRPQKWTHVAVTRSDTSVSLYVNGVLDMVKEVGAGCNNDGSLYLGGTPRSTCDFSAYMDEVRYYQRVVDAVEIAAEASPALGGVRPSFAHLGCQNCTLDEAKLSCRPSYHLCTTMELYTGAFAVARILGYTDWRSNVWTTADVVAQAKAQNKNRRLYALVRGSTPNKNTKKTPQELRPGTAMCCSDVL